ncbi:MAG: hypothetical protein M0D53_14135 [Flavobacterium sp. JAD_PAG50586_2]|nr:MAG: hypothetical protein M0D53_14135 [Flavobacterium sp. JAD_PAG50586_2]
MKDEYRTELEELSKFIYYSKFNYFLELLKSQKNHPIQFQAQMDALYNFYRMDKKNDAEEVNFNDVI